MVAFMCASPWRAAAVVLIGAGIVWVLCVHIQ
jgi:hypothetical protein